MSIDHARREVLRQRALENWENTKDLRRETERQILRAEMGQTRSAELHARAELVINRARELAMSLAPKSRSFDPPNLLEYLVDRALERDEPLDMGEGTAALVASGGLAELVRLKQLASSRCSYVVGSLDAGTALGLAIATQPDLAIIEDQLEVASGIDMALSLPTYTPSTKVLVLTDDEEAAHDLRSVGIEVGPSHAPASLVLSWIESAA